MASEDRARQIAKEAADRMSKEKREREWKRKLKKHLDKETPSVSKSIERVFYDADKYSHVGKTDSVTKVLVPM